MTSRRVLFALGAVGLILAYRYRKGEWPVTVTVEPTDA